MKKINKTILIIIIMANMQSCYYDNPPELIPFDCAEVSYSTHIQPIWDKACATSGCHDGTREPNLLEEVSWTNLLGGYINLSIPEESSLYKSVIFAENPMPPGGPKISSLDIELINCWISEGGLNN